MSLQQHTINTQSSRQFAITCSLSFAHAVCTTAAITASTGFSHHSTAAWQMHNNSTNNSTANHYHRSAAAKGGLHTDAATAPATAAAANSSQRLYPTDSLAVRIPVKLDQLPGCIQLQQQGDSPAGLLTATSNGVWGGTGLQLLMKLPWNMEVRKSACTCYLSVLLEHMCDQNMPQCTLADFYVLQLHKRGMCSFAAHRLLLTTFASMTNYTMKLL
jgi:hypothetical protein